MMAEIRKFECCMTFSNFLFTSSLFTTSSFDFLSAHATFLILLYNHISNVSIHVPVSFLRVHVLHPYNRVAQMYVFINLIFVIRLNMLERKICLFAKAFI